MSAQQTDTSTSNYSWGTLVIVLWVVIGGGVLGFLIKNGDLDKKTSEITVSAPGAPAAEPAAATAPEAPAPATVTPAAPDAVPAPAPDATPAPTPTTAPAPAVTPAPATPAPAPTPTAGA